MESRHVTYSKTSPRGFSGGFFLHVERALGKKLFGDTYSLIHKDVVALRQLEERLRRETCIRIGFNASWLSLKPRSSWKARTCASSVEPASFLRDGGLGTSAFQRECRAAQQ